jgi:hypothetical protein
MGGSTGGMMGTGNSGGGSFAQPMTGADYNRRLQAGESSQTIRDSQKGGGLFGTGQGLSDNQFNDIVTQAGMQSPTGRPLAGSAQFYQPVYQPQYMNYARPATQFDVSMYGTQPVQSPASFSGVSRGDINNAIGNFFQQNPNSDINSTLNAMRNSGINRTDIQAFGGVNNYGPSPQQQFGGFMPQMQTPFRQPMQQQFNPYTNNFGGGFGGFMPQQQFMPQMQQQFMPQMQTPFQQPMQQTQSPFRSSGPSQPIVGRSSQMRGTPNVMRRAEGGIASLMDEA